MKNISPVYRLHFIVLLWGFTGVVGKLISLSAMPLVFLRMFFTAIIIYLFLRFKKHSLRVNRKIFIKLILIGFIIAMHWFTFFLSIKISNVAVALSTLSTGAFFTALLQPIFLRKKIQLSEILFATIVSACIVMIFNVETQYFWGIVIGLICSFLSALFSVLNAKIHQQYNASVIVFYEILGGCALIFLLIFFNNSYTELLQIQYIDIFWTLILAGLLTAYPMIESVSLMKHFSPYTLLLTVNLEPVYGIILAYFIWQEQEKMSALFYVCTAIILLVLVLDSLVKNHQAKKEK